MVPSLFSSAYVLNWPSYFDVELKASDAPSFDARATPYPLEKEIHDYLSWRQEDCEFQNCLVNVSPQYKYFIIKSSTFQKCHICAFVRPDLT